MPNLQTKDINLGNICKNVLYKVPKSMQIPFVELHKDKCEKVFLDYKLADEQFGIYATEYRAPVIKKGIKTTDIIACIVDEKQKNIYTLIADVKSNISSFSDDLSKGDALITAIKEVRDFSEQIEDGLLHKENFLMYHKNEGFNEKCDMAIFTRNFESEKFRDAARYIESLLYDDNETGQILAKSVMKRNLMRYKGEEKRLLKFAEQKLLIRDKELDLKVYLLKKEKNSGDYTYKISLKL